MTREAWAARFEIRYGAGEYARLCAQFEQARHTFSSIAEHYGVTRERVRQWHRLLMPDAPTGRERRRLHRRQEDWRDLLHDDLFRAFFEHARRHVPAERIRPVRTTHGYSRASVLLNRRHIALRRATPRARKHRPSQIFRITTPAPPAQYVYVLLPGDTFFLLPCSLLPRRGTVFQDAAGSKYLRFKNTFDAIHFVHTDDGDRPPDRHAKRPAIVTDRPGGE